MNKESKLIGVGNSTGILLSRELLAESGFEQGDEVVVKASDGKIEIERKTQDFDRQMKIARDVMKRRFSALRQLAK
ncbi:MAG: AbrB/MazE/SpoVT family DNA-binding domain-containing protein [Sphingomicrobium sp.]|nr:AbrB/MazE/SpoVT family DNA-binding domain-containing protein [Sphingomonadales bacterium]